MVEGSKGSEAPAVLALNVYISVSLGGSQARSQAGLSITDLRARVENLHFS